MLFRSMTPGLGVMAYTLVLIGLENEIIKFKQETVSNDMEITQRLAMYSEIPVKWKMAIDPLFSDDVVELILADIAKNELGYDVSIDGDANTYRFVRGIDNEELENN